MKRSLLLAALIVGTSLAAAYGFDALGLQQLARYALLPIYPAVIAVVGAAGGFHGAPGEPVWMIVAGIVAFVIWVGVITLFKKSRAQRRL